LEWRKKVGNGGISDDTTVMYATLESNVESESDGALEDKQTRFLLGLRKAGESESTDTASATADMTESDDDLI
jgi:hypothetical protein